jgi:DNA anti-recombination protein RmuC
MPKSRNRGGAKAHRQRVKARKNRLQVQQKQFQEKMIEMMNQQKELEKEEENVIDVTAEPLEGQYDENTPIDIKL